MIPTPKTVRSAAPIVLLSLVASLLHGCGGDADLPPAGATAPRLAAQVGQVGQPAAGTVRLGDAPTVADAARAAAAARGTEHSRAADGASLAIDTQDREAVRLFYNHVYVQPAVPMEWTGDYASGRAGSVGAAWQAATSLRLNWYRAMAGVPAATTISPVFSAKDQEAALLMSVNGQLSHSPPASWKFYTATAAEAAGSSNLALGATGAQAIESYISDYGDNNGPVGHRRWIFYPQTRVFGSGDVPPAQSNGSSLWGANALWVFDGNYGAARPRVRDDFVAWPARGYAPYPVVFGRWSLSYPDADFSQATVSVTRDGAPVAATVETRSTGFGENTIVWQVAGIPRDGRHARPAADVRYHVTVAGTTVAGAARRFEYDVVVFDPVVETPGAARAQVSAPAMVDAGATYTAQVTQVPGATGYALLSYRRTPLAALAPSDYSAAGWSLGANASGGTFASGAVHLYMDNSATASPQVATLNRKLLVDAGGGALSLTRALGYATPTQVFRVQVSKDDGASWSDVYSEAGKDTPVAAGTLSMSLNAYAGRVVRLRLLVEDTVSRYTGEESGWTVRDLAFSGVSELGDERVERNASGTFVLAAGQAGNVVLVPRVQYQGLYDGDGGAPAYVAVDGAVLHGPRNWYTLSRANGVLTIADNVGTDGVQTVRNPYRLDFTDVSLAFDVDGNAGKAYRLYRAALGRQPDLAGLGFWIAALDGGVTLDAMTDGFATSAEFQTLYLGKSNEQLVDALYRNLLGREPDPAGAAFWVRQLASGQPLRALLVAISESAENRERTAGETALGILFTRAR
ncbi:DUF4214 domain-containing protein [uncultured Massilia sp.]|uniref:DUF4214 domain-containing protein n=1 Tax=uncultured Massilia sp. TaxID=169973 RepID=UPI0025FB9AC8|nr:DUF4214 domain-containing protein [uncultured Massilia sp.]